MHFFLFVKKIIPRRKTPDFQGDENRLLYMYFFNNLYKQWKTLQVLNNHNIRIKNPTTVFHCLPVEQLQFQFIPFLFSVICEILENSYSQIHPVSLTLREFWVDQRHLGQIMETQRHLRKVKNRGNNQKLGGINIGISQLYFNLVDALSFSFSPQLGNTYT